MKISLCMIVRDEETVIARCINSVKEVIDEIIIVDTGSVDKTVAIVEELGAKVYYFEWIDDFASARNYSFSKATGDYILWLDADDVIITEDLIKMKNLKETLDKNIDSVAMNYIIKVDEKGDISESLLRNRLVKREKNFQWIGEVHEYLEVKGSIFKSDIQIFHKKDKNSKDRNLRIYEKLLKQGKNLNPRDIYHYAAELEENDMIDEAIEQYTKYLDSNDEWLSTRKISLKKLINLYSYKNDIQNQIKYIIELSKYDIPRGDWCCIVADNFLQSGEINKAIKWYYMAIMSEEDCDDYDSYTYIPWISLCLCFVRKQNYKLAYQSNEKAAKYKPNDIHVIHNRKLLQDKI